MILALNAGSSSMKFAVFAPDGAAALRGQIEGSGAAARLIARGADGAVLAERNVDAGTHEAVLGELLGFIDGHLGAAGLRAAGHRVVHGGREFAAPVRITAASMGKMEALVPLAPLHQPQNLAPIRALSAARPGLPQVACFDTAFHHAMPELSARIALPSRFAAEGIRRYGFHGLSYEYIAQRLRTLAPAVAAGRVIAAHLGNGASLCAMHNGRSVDTTMGFSALDGLVMGTRCGSLDPGVVLHLIEQRGMSAATVERLLYEESGLLGVSGLSNDMRVLLASSTPAAREAVELFVFRLAREAGGLASTLGGLDGLVFTAGIGEHAAPVRAAVCERLAWLGVRLDTAANARGDGVISTPSSRVGVYVIPTDEEAMIARYTFETIA